MRVVIQRVSKASVTVSEEIIGQINKGIVVLLGIGADDGKQDIDYLVDKIVNLRIFEDQDEKMNLSLIDIKGDVLIVSNFTLYADCRKGRRPSFSSAAKPEFAKEMYARFIEEFRKYSIKVEIGEFQATMDVNIYNDGPVTMILDSKIR